MTKRQKIGISLIILPGLLLVLSLFLQIFVRFIFNDVVVVKKVMNIITLMLGFVAVAGGLPSVIGGVIMLATKGKNEQIGS